MRSSASRSRLLVALMVAAILTTVLEQASVTSTTGVALSFDAAAAAALSRAASVRAAGRGRPEINLSAGRDLVTDYAGGAIALPSLRQGHATPLALTSADFDEDGVSDLVAAYSTPDGAGVVTVHRGNLDAIYRSNLYSLSPPPHAQESGDASPEDAPFLSPALAFDSDLQPDFALSGDFDADGHFDLVIGSRGKNRLSLLRGDGKGSLGAPRSIELPGTLTAMVVGDVDRPDGLADVAVGVRTESAAEVLVFEGPAGALNSQPEVVRLKREVRSLAIGRFSGGQYSDLAIACGSRLLIRRGCDRQLSVDPDPGRLSAVPPIDQVKFSGRLAAVAAGDFSGTGGPDIAALTDDGALQIVSRDQHSWRKQTHASLSGGATGLIAARVSSEPFENVITADPPRRTLSVASQSGLRESLAVEGEPVAILAMRLNGDALSDLVILRRGAVAPALVFSLASSTFVVTSTGDDGPGTLRQAILDANSNAGADIITFKLGSGTPVINVGNVGLGPLPMLTDAVTINGATGGATRIEINGSPLASSVVSGFDVMATGCTIRSMVVSQFAGGIGIFIGGNGNFVENCLVGINSGGTAAAANQSGVTVTGSNNVIGGTSVSARNVVSGNSGEGISLTLSGSGNQVRGNFIGVNSLGTAPVPNGFNGVNVTDGSIGNVIGGTAAGSRNVISGNLPDGIFMVTDSILVQGNFIGTNAAGTTAIPNSSAGVHLTECHVVTVGGTTPAARNIISGNPFAGVSVDGSGSNGNQAQGNFIGTDASGTAAIPNGDGVRLDDITNQTIGGIGSAGNVISGNLGNGVLFTMTTSSNNLFGNLIGVKSDGVTALGNQGFGVFFSFAGFNNRIGGTVPGQGNVIAFSAGSGVIIKGTGNSVLGNSIFGNGDLGIDLDADQVTPNDNCDPDTGANNLQNFPTLSTATSTGNSLTVQGTLDSTPNTTFRVELFANPTCDLVGNGEGQTFLGAATVITNAACVGNINVTLPVSVPLGQSITATATGPANNTSEFSQCVSVTAGPCVFICSNSLAVPADGDKCGAVVNYPPPTATGGCGTVTCVPPAGSVFPLGVTPVSCASGVGPACSFTLTVTDQTPPKISCPGDITKSLPVDARDVVVDYVIATASDNCGTEVPVCLPPSGVAFPLGVTNVTCTAKDAANNTSICSFSVNVIDGVAPSIQCPASISVDVGAGQTSATVTYPPPIVSDDMPGVTSSCLPASGSAFPVGVTTVTCTAVDSSSNTSRCSFTITVNASATIKLVIPGDKPSVDFVVQTPKRKTPKNLICQSFAVQNTGASSTVLTFASLERTAPNINRLADRDDTGLFLLSLVDAQQTETPLSPGSHVTVGGGETKNFCVRFNPRIPRLTGATTGLRAFDVVPSQINSTITFSVQRADPLLVPLVGRVATGVVFSNPDKPKKAPVLSFERSADTFVVTHTNYDSNTDVKMARYEFLNAQGEAMSFDIDLSEPIRNANLATGQSFQVEMRFSGAESHPEITSVRLTVFDGEASISAIVPLGASSSAASTQLPVKAQRAKVYRRSVAIRP